MYKYMCERINVWINVCVNICMYKRTYKRMYKCMYKHIYKCMCERINVWINVCMNICMYKRTYKHMYKCMYKRMYDSWQRKHVEKRDKTCRDIFKILGKKEKAYFLSMIPEVLSYMSQFMRMQSVLRYDAFTNGWKKYILSKRAVHREERRYE